jgi:hypothetical protein
VGIRGLRNYSRGSTKPSSAPGQKKSIPTRSILLFHPPFEPDVNAEPKPLSTRRSPYAYFGSEVAVSVHIARGFTTKLMTTFTSLYRPYRPTFYPSDTRASCCFWTLSDSTPMRQAQPPAFSRWFSDHRDLQLPRTQAGAGRTHREAIRSPEPCGMVFAAQYQHAHMPALLRREGMCSQLTSSRVVQGLLWR